jgi:hypothetical protein
MIGQQPATTVNRTERRRSGRRLFATSLAVAAAVVLTAFGGSPAAHAAAPASPVAPPSMLKPAIDPGQPGSAYQFLTPADIKAVTGADVRPMSSQEVVCFIGNCGAYATQSGQTYMMINMLTGQQEIELARQNVSPIIFKDHEQPVGIGDRADLFKDNAESTVLRVLIVQQGDNAVSLAPFIGWDSISDQQLFDLATLALQHHAQNPSE